MLRALQSSGTRAVSADAALTEKNIRAFSASVVIALATADSVTVDLTRTKTVDSWALLELSDLAATFAPRLIFAGPDYLLQTLERLKPKRTQ